jgi:hypothetical protein
MGWVAHRLQPRRRHHRHGAAGNLVPRVFRKSHVAVHTGLGFRQTEILAGQLPSQQHHIAITAHRVGLPKDVFIGKRRALGKVVTLVIEVVLDLPRHIAHPCRAPLHPRKPLRILAEAHLNQPKGQRAHIHQIPVLAQTGARSVHE